MRYHLQRSVFPLTVFVSVMGAHFVWLCLFPEQDPIQNRWASVPANDSSWWDLYLNSQSYWLGLSYSMSLTFAAAALRRYREQRSCSSRRLAVGSVTFSGFLAAIGCFLVGCCGSPMLVVYMNLFGAAFLPYAKPILTLLTAVSLLITWLWMTRQSASESAKPRQEKYEVETDSNVKHCC